MVAHGNNGNFSFTQQIINLSSYGIEPRSIFAGDFDGDGDPDLAAADIAHEYVSVLMNNGDGTFTLPPANYSVDTDPVAIFGGDLDGDGDLDLATANLGNENVSVLKNNGDGTFQFYSNFSVGNNPRSLYAADLGPCMTATLTHSTIHIIPMTIIRKRATIAARTIRGVVSH